MFDEQWLREQIANGSVMVDADHSHRDFAGLVAVKTPSREDLDQLRGKHLPSLTTSPIFAAAAAETKIEIVDLKPKWTQTERRFALEHLEPGLEHGEYLFWTDQVPFRLVGHTYTPDFVAVTPTGELHIFEIKGKHGLGSESRSSVKTRWVVSVFVNAPNVKLFWCKLRKDGTFAVRQVKNRRELHPMIRGER